MKKIPQSPSHLIVTQCVARGDFYEAKDSGAYISFWGAFRVIWHMVESICVSCARALGGV